ncbi:MAG: DUF1353 domain-containing protein [Cyanobacteria bacterium P01_A01_bin.68]
MQTPNEPVKSNLPRAKVSYNPQNNVWTLEEEYCYFDEIKQSKLVLHKGFEFDLSSIPRAFWRMVAIHELSIEAPLVHDFMYMSKGGERNHYFEKKGKFFCKNKIFKEILASIESLGKPYSRKEADDLFLKMMEEAGVSKWRKWFGYIGVRLFGGLYWKPKKHDDKQIIDIDDRCLSLN